MVDSGAIDLSAADALRFGASELGITLSEGQLGQFGAYADLLRKWNAKVNLVSRQDTHRITSRHLLDSLSALAFVRGPKVLDIGSGGGLPGLPIAIANSELDVLLLERSERKARFLEAAVLHIGLGNVRVQCADAAAAQVPRFDTVLARGVGAPAEVWRLAEPWLADLGRLVLMHSTRPEVAAPSEIEACVDSHAVNVPGLAQPHQILLLSRGGLA